MQRQKLIAIALLATAALAGVGAAWADGHERIVEVWTCEMKEGKTAKDVHAANAKWVKLMNEKVEGGDIHSYVLTPIVGERDQFMFADSFPSMAAWVAHGEVMESEAGQALDEEFNDIFECSENTLHKSTES